MNSPDLLYTDPPVSEHSLPHHFLSRPHFPPGLSTTRPSFSPSHICTFLFIIYFATRITIRLTHSNLLSRQSSNRFKYIQLLPFVSVSTLLRPIEFLTRFTHNFHSTGLLCLFFLWPYLVTICDPDPDCLLDLPTQPISSTLIRIIVCTACSHPKCILTTCHQSVIVTSTAVPS